MLQQLQVLAENDIAGMETPSVSNSNWATFKLNASLQEQHNFSPLILKSHGAAFICKIIFATNQSCNTFFNNSRMELLLLFGITRRTCKIFILKTRQRDVFLDKCLM